MKQYTTVAEFVADLDPAKKEQVELLRSIITTAHAELTEHIKWNSPSYALDDTDRVTINLLNKEGVVNLVLHMGGTRKEDKKGQPVLTDDKGLVDWRSDVRGLMTFSSVADIQAKKADIASIVSRWLAIR
jgi:hypothetical protein